MRHVFLLSLMLLAGCVSAQERVQQARAANDARDDQQCQSYGAVPGSDVYVNCRAQITAARIAAPGPVTCTRVGNTTACN